MKSSQAANPGMVRPPLVHLLSIFTALIVNRLWPVQTTFGIAADIVSIVCLIIGVMVFYKARQEFQRSKTPIPGNQPVTAMITTGIFRFSRNPIYVSFFMLHSSAVFWFQSLWVLLALITSVWIIDHVVIRREEHYLEQTFGQVYTNYKNTVRRWI